MADTNLPEIASKLRRMAAMHLNVKPAAIETAPLSDVGAKQSDIIDLVLMVETEFDVSIKDLEIEGLASVNDIAALVAKKLGVEHG